MAGRRLSAGRLRALMGRIHDANGDWHIPLLAVALISLVMVVCGALAGRDREIHPEDDRQRPLPVGNNAAARRNACTSGAGRPSSA